MIPVALVRQYAQGQQIAYEVADQEVVLHYALALLAESGLVGHCTPGDEPGPLLFKGGTALRKCVFGSAGRALGDDGTRHLRARLRRARRCWADRP